MPLLQAFCIQEEIELTAFPQIKFSEQTFSIKKPYQVIFFSSPRCVDFFLLNETIPDDVKIACVGASTADHLTKKGLQPDFIGSFPGDPDKNAKELSEWVSDRSVLFPVSSISKGSMNKFIPADQIEIVQVYITEFCPKKVADHDIYIFSSPSNVDSFLEVNKAPETIVIAWGKTTESCLLSKEIPVAKVLNKSNESELIELLEVLIHGN